METLARIHFMWPHSTVLFVMITISILILWVCNSNPTHSYGSWLWLTKPYTLSRGLLMKRVHTPVVIVISAKGCSALREGKPLLGMDNGW